MYGRIEAYYYVQTYLFCENLRGMSLFHEKVVISRKYVIHKLTLSTHILSQRNSIFFFGGGGKLKDKIS